MPVPAPPLPVRDRLRAETRPEHDAIEATAYGRALADGAVPLAAYAAHVGAWSVLLGALEGALARSGHPLFGGLPGELARAPHARADRQALEARLGRGIAVPVPARDFAATLATWTDRPALLGAWYVFEGSAMGGLRIRQALTARHGTDLPTRILVPAPDGPGRRWKQVCARLADLPDDTGDDVVHGARTTFRALTAVFQALPAAEDAR